MMSPSQEFLHRLYGNLERGWLTLFSIDPSNGQRFTSWHAGNALEAMADDAVRQSGLGRHVWFGVATRFGPLDKGQRGGVSDCQELTALWVDIDIAGPNHKDSARLPDEATARVIMRAFPVPPSIIVTTGGGVHGYWLLDEPTPAVEVAGLLDRWAVTWDRISEEHGCRIDNVFDVPRVLRMPGTVNQKNGAPVQVARWSEVRYSPSDLLDIVDEVKLPAPSSFTSRDPLMQRDALMSPEGPADRYNARTTWPELLEGDGWTFSHTADGIDYWTRPGKTTREGISATVGWKGNDALKVMSDALEWLPGGVAGDTTYSRFQYYARRWHGGDERAAAQAIMVDEQLRSEKSDIGAPRATMSGNDDWSVVAPVVDESIWEERAFLRHIRTAARSRLVAPAAVLGAVLARVAAWTPPSTCLPPIIGGRAPLSLYVALHGNSGDGKSTPMVTAEDLLPEVPPGCVGPLALGTGEGLVEAFQGMVKVPDPEGGKKDLMVKKQVFRGALFSLDEGQLLAELGARKGATIMPVLRTAWSGGDPGQANASLDARRSLKRGSYHVGLVSLWQTHTAQALLADADGGTPQRFVWFDVADGGASMDTPPWPGPLEWTPPPVIGMDGLVGHDALDVADAVLHEIKAARVAHQRRETVASALDGHRNLNKLKLAGVLCVLDGRHGITESDWALAERILTASDHTRDWIVSEGIRAQALERAGKVAAKVNEARTMAATEASDATLRAARACYRAAARRPDTHATRRNIVEAISSRDRHLVTVDDAIAEAIRLKWIVATDDTYTAGQAKPA